jgi:membrane-associated phospholipid phosphatase
VSSVQWFQFNGFGVVALLLLTSGSALAQPTAIDPSFDLTPREERIAEIVSTAAVVGAVSWGAVEAWRASDRRKAVTQLAVSQGLTLAVSRLLKHTVHRDRPCEQCGAEVRKHSFPSAHTGFAAAAGTSGIGISLTVTVGAGRALSGKHWLTDTLVGAGIGWASHWVGGRVARGLR